MREIFKRFGKNLYGRDFVVGDIHGCFTKLEEALQAVRFDKLRDRLFSVGDLVDRGPESDEAVYYLMNEKWFHAVMGNHEQMLIDSLNPDYPDADVHHYQNGGVWFYGLPLVEKQCIALVMADLPLAIEIETDRGLIGIVHAEVPMDDWRLFRSMYAANETHFEAVALWARTRLSRGYSKEVSGIHHVYVGHSSVEEVGTLGNVTYVDTGSGFSKGRITLMQIGGLEFEDVQFGIPKKMAERRPSPAASYVH